MSLLAALISVGLGTGCSDSKITAYTTPPEVTIQTPPDGATVEQAVAVSMRGLVVDKEYSTTLSSLTAQWSVDGGAICEGSLVDDGGNIDCVYTFPTAGAVTLALTVTNPDGASATATSEITVSANGSPTVEILLPDSTSHYYADQPTIFQATATDAEDLSGDLVATWTSDLDGILDIDDTPADDGELAGDAILTEGEHLISLEVEDTTGLVGTDTVTITVGPDNSAPSCEITAPDSNGTFEDGAVVLFEGTASDPDVASDSLSISWTSNIDGELSTASPTSAGTMTFGVSSLSSATHTITLTVQDEVGASCSDAILLTVGNGPNIVIDLPTTDSIENEGDSVTFQATVSDPDNAATDLDITWESDVDGPISRAGADSTGISSFSMATLSVGSHTISATAVDPDGFYSTDTIRLTINGLPTQPVVVIDPSSPSTSDALTATIVTDSVDPEGAGVSYSYAWQRDGASTSYSSVSVPSTATARDETWTVSVTPSDPYGSGTAGTDSVVIGNAAPSVASASITPSSPVEGDTLTCTPGTTADADGDTVSLSYQWTVSGSSAGGSGDTLSSDYFGRGDTITCTITPNDGFDDGSSVSSAEVTVQNTAPELASVTLSPTSAYESSTLICSPGTGTDVDGDTITYSYDWVVSGSSLGLDSATLDGSWFDKTDTVYCRVTPTDGTDSGTTVDSNTITVQNSAPVLASATLSPTTATEATTLSCTPGATSDDDGDTVSLSYAWTVDGADIGISSTSLTGANFDKNNTVQCAITPSDGTIAGTTVTSSAVVIGNTAPSATSVTISPTDPYTDDTLTATPSGWSDVDGDSEAYNYQWYVDSTAVSSGGTSQTLAGSAFLKHEMVYVIATPTDGTDSGSPVTSDEVEILNTAPTAPTVLVSPSDAEPQDDLSCAVTTDSYDADGDVVTYAYSWWLDGVVSSVTSSTLDYSYTVDGDTWTCQVTPQDDDEVGTAGSDAQEVVDRTAPNQPVISAIDEYRNTTSVSLSGTAEADSTVTIYMDCDDGSLTDTVVTASSAGTWSATMTISRGLVCDYYAYATDAHGNISPVSNTVTTESCDPYDSYEDSTGYGDTCVDSVDEWTVLADGGTSTIEITGNIIDTTDSDWYVIDTSQSVTSTGTNVYRLDVTMPAGSSEYSFEVYRGSCASSDLDTCGEASGLTGYDYYAQDVGDGVHVIPTDTRQCSTGSVSYNDCDDLSTTYYLHVSRTSSTLSCGYYQLHITNGVW